MYVRPVYPYQPIDNGGGSAPSIDARGAFVGVGPMLGYQQLAQNWEATARYYADHRKGCPRRDAKHEYTEACRCGHDAIFNALASDEPLARKPSP